jgi:hypothetical protein
LKIALRAGGVKTRPDSFTFSFLSLLQNKSTMKGTSAALAQIHKSGVRKRTAPRPRLVKMAKFAIDWQMEMLYLLLPPQGGKRF